MTSFVIRYVAIVSATANSTCESVLSILPFGSLSETFCSSSLQIHYRKQKEARYTSRAIVAYRFSLSSVRRSAKSQISGPRLNVLSNSRIWNKMFLLFQVCKLSGVAVHHRQVMTKMIPSWIRMKVDSFCTYICNFTTTGKNKLLAKILRSNLDPNIPTLLWGER